MNPRKSTSSFSKREKTRRNPFNRRNNRSISFRLWYIFRSYAHGCTRVLGRGTTGMNPKAKASYSTIPTSEIDTCNSAGQSCEWQTIDHQKLRIRPGGGRGCRTTVRHACASTSMTGYRNMVDVDLVGRFDPPDQYTRIANVTCRATTGGRAYTN